VSERPLRAAVVGCGAVTERYHLPALLASPDVEVVACVDPSLERARSLAERVRAPLALDGHAGLAGSVDLALVAAPNAVHERIAVDLLSAGVHVLVEKPMARSAAECDRMIEAAAATGAVLSVGHAYRHYPVARFAHELFAAGALGAVRRVDVRQNAGGRWPAASTAVLTREAGGGVLLDIGVHTLDLLLWWLGDLRVVAYRDDAAGGVESECEAELELGGGAPVAVELSRTRNLRDTTIVKCERGVVEIGIYEPAVVRLAMVGGGTTLAGGVPDAEFERAPVQTLFARQLADVVAAVRHGAPPLVGGREGRRAVALVEECYALRRPLRRPWDYPEAYAAIGRTGP